jgi:hypothetical protein
LRLLINERRFICLSYRISSVGPTLQRRDECSGVWGVLPEPVFEVTKEIAFAA